jgi:hypothetical protein
MKYLCLGYQDEKSWERLSESERKTLAEQAIDYQDLLRNSGHLIECSALRANRATTTLRFESGKISVSAGAITDSKENLMAFLIIEARDLNLAIQLLSRLPCMRHGGFFEIRPIDEDNSR